MARPKSPERNVVARSFRQLRQFLHLSNADKVFGTHRRRLFKQLTVDENLRMGAYARGDTREIHRDLDRVYEMFPRLAERKSGKAGFLSGGEQQMAALGRGIMARPVLMLLDEPTMGLAPAIAEEVFSVVKSLNRDSGIAFLLSEQNLALALSVAGASYVLQNGRISDTALSATVINQNDIESAYFGHR